MSNTNLIFENPIVNGPGARWGQTCSVELLGLAIYGDLRHGDHLPCIDAGCQSAFRRANDGTSVEVKQTRRWRLLLARLSTCHETGNVRVRQRMALWAARSVEHLSVDPRVKACNEATEQYLAGEIDWETLKEAAYAAADAAAYAAAYAANAAADDAAAAAANAAYYAAARDEAYMDWLDRYLTAWQKVAADEGCLLPEDAEAEYVAFVEALDWTAADAPTRRDLNEDGEAECWLHGVVDCWQAPCASPEQEVSDGRRT
jgi:hypothetical protein